MPSCSWPDSRSTRTCSSSRSWRPRCRSSGGAERPGMSRAVRTYLEMTDPSALEEAPAPGPGVAVAREQDAPPGLWRFLYTEVGREYHWVDRLRWTDDEIRAYLADPTL